MSNIVSISSSVIIKSEDVVTFVSDLYIDGYKGYALDVPIPVTYANTEDRLSLRYKYVSYSSDMHMYLYRLECIVPRDFRTADCKIIRNTLRV